MHVFAVGKCAAGQGVVARNGDVPERLGHAGVYGRISVLREDIYQILRSARLFAHKGKGERGHFRFGKCGVVYQRYRVVQRHGVEASARKSPRLYFPYAVGNYQIGYFFSVEIQIVGMHQGIGIFAFKHNAAPRFEVGNMHLRKIRGVLECVEGSYAAYTAAYGHGRQCRQVVKSAVVDVQFAAAGNFKADYLLIKLAVQIIYQSYGQGRRGYLRALEGVAASRLNVVENSNACYWLTVKCVVGYGSDKFEVGNFHVSGHRFSAKQQSDVPIHQVFQPRYLYPARRIRVACAVDYHCAVFYYGETVTALEGV